VTISDLAHIFLNIGVVDNKMHSVVRKPAQNASFQ
jgi:hypothetical protein